MQIAGGASEMKTDQAGPGGIARFLCNRYRAFRQKEGQVATRADGARFLSPPRPAFHEAMKHHQYAWLSVAAYGHANDKEKEDCAVTTLAGYHWKRWELNSFLEDDVIRKMEELHLRADVWERPNSDGSMTVSVIFGGTVITNLNDLLSNLRWFLPFHDDEYTATVRLFSPLFAAKLNEEPYRTCVVKLVATGHSLGAGLAQQFAYSLQAEPNVPRVEEVYAFDPSPVTGYFRVAKGLRSYNCDGLKIDRIYERGEILAILRAFTSAIFPPSRLDPAICGARYMLMKSENPVKQHSIVRMAEGLEHLVSQAPATVTAPGDCA